MWVSVSKPYGDQPRDHPQLCRASESTSTTSGSDIVPCCPPQSASPLAFELSADTVVMRMLSRDLQIPSVSSHRLTENMQGLLHQGTWRLYRTLKNSSLEKCNVPHSFLLQGNNTQDSGRETVIPVMPWPGSSHVSCISHSLISVLWRKVVSTGGNRRLGCPERHSCGTSVPTWFQRDGRSEQAGGCRNPD